MPSALPNVFGIPFGDLAVGHLEMLIVLAVGPLSSPLETMLDEQVVARIALHDLVVKRRFAVEIDLLFKVKG